MPRPKTNTDRSMIRKKARVLQSFTSAFTEEFITQRLGCDFHTFYSMGKVYLKILGSVSDRGEKFYFSWHYPVNDVRTSTLVKILRYYGFVDNLKTVDQSPYGLLGIAFRHPTKNYEIDENTGRLKHPMKMSIRTLISLEYTDTMVGMPSKTLESYKQGEHNPLKYTGFLGMGHDGSVLEYESNGSKGDYDSSLIRRNFLLSTGGISLIVREVLNSVDTRVVKTIWLVGEESIGSESSHLFDRFNILTGVNEPAQYDMAIHPAGDIPIYESLVREGKKLAVVMTGGRYFHGVVDSTINHDVMSVQGCYHIAVTQGIFYELMTHKEVS